VALWLPLIEAWLDAGAQPTAIHERLKREQSDYGGQSVCGQTCVSTASPSAGRDTEEAVAIPVETSPGEVAQVDFGYVGKLLDPATMTMRKAWVFVMVLGRSRHMYCELSVDQKVETWLSVWRRGGRTAAAGPVRSSEAKRTALEVCCPRSRLSHFFLAVRLRA